MVDLDILYHDTAIVVVNKPGGLLSVPGRGPDKQDCIVQRIRHRFPECIPQPSVHRLDMETSGLMVLALTPEAHRNLSIQFQNRTVQKQYLAILKGIVEKEQGEIELAFRLDVANRPYQMFDPAKWQMGHHPLGENGRRPSSNPDSLYAPDGQDPPTESPCRPSIGIGMPDCGGSALW
jgi:tRNA pseudouridine32 synthase / 23S rRNA pseudouridine746 synthase